MDTYILAYISINNLFFYNIYTISEEFVGYVNNAALSLSFFLEIPNLIANANIFMISSACGPII